MLNAAKHLPTICPLFEPHTLRHYAYLRDTMSNLVPDLNLPGSHCHTISRPMSVPESLQFLQTVVGNLDISENSYRMQAVLFQTAKEHLKRLSDVDDTVAGTAQFIALYIGGQLLFTQILESGLLSNPGTLATQPSNIVKSQINQLLEHCLKLEHFFVGLSPEERCIIKQFKLKVLGLNLVYIVKGGDCFLLLYY